eukprot:6827598-Ditylum_brightwellii.AAC.1
MDVQNTQQQHCHSINCRLGLIEKNTRRMALQPARRAVRNEAPSIEEGKEEEKEDKSTAPFIATLSKCPHDLSCLVG